MPHFLSHQEVWQELPVIALNIICILSKFQHFCSWKQAHDNRGIVKSLYAYLNRLDYTNCVWGGLVFEINITTLENMLNALFEERFKFITHERIISGDYRNTL